MKNKKGFTLVEIMIVVVIIGLLVVMAIPAFNKVRDDSRKSAVENNLRQIANAAERYFLASGSSQAAESDIIGVNAYVNSVTAVAGEDYGTDVFPVADTFTQLSTTLNSGDTITYDR